MSSSAVLTTPTQQYPFYFAGRRPSMDAKERFYRQFQEEVTILQEQIKQLGSIAIFGGERQDATDSILAGISNLSNEVADASDFVPTYDQRTYAQALKALTDQLNQETARLAPKSRFQFKARTASSASTSDTASASRLAAAADPRHARGVPQPVLGASSALTEEPDAVPELPTFPKPKNYNELISQGSPTRIRKPSFSSARDISISDHAGLHIMLPPTAARATASGSLTNLKECIVDMSVPTAGRGGSFGTLVMRNIKRSLVVAGHVDGPAHVTGIKDSVVVVAARQVRIHECKNVDVYLHCGSRPIIEDCSGMRFAPIPSCYVSEKEASAQNQWDQVDDFKWLKAEHSPNWMVLPEGERISLDIWKNRVPGGPGVGLTDILKETGIGQR